MFFGVASSFKCLVVYRRAFKSPSDLDAGWSFNNLTQPLTSTLEALTKAPWGWTWSYRITRPTITLKTNIWVSSLWNWAIKFLKNKKKFLIINFFFCCDINTYGFSSILKQTFAIVLKVSVRLSFGISECSRTNLAVASLRTLSMGVAFA